MKVGERKFRRQNKSDAGDRRAQMESSMQRKIEVRRSGDQRAFPIVPSIARDRVVRLGAAPKLSSLPLSLISNARMPFYPIFDSESSQLFKRT